MNSDRYDIYPDASKENWSGIAGLFFLPLILLVLGFAFVRNIRPVTNSVTAYLPAIGIGGGPPALKPQHMESDSFVITDASLNQNKLTGYIDKQLYDNGGRVYLNLVSTYNQTCVDNNQTDTESQNVVISKNADQYEVTNTNDGYMWTINVLLTEPTDLCPDDSARGDNINRDMMGKVYVSNNEGRDTLTDDSGKPYEVNLDL